MPTQHRRHSVTETPELTEVLAPLRARVPDVRFGELVELGAREKLRQLDAAEPNRQAAWARLADRVRTRDTGGDPELADRARREGWAPR